MDEEQSKQPKATSGGGTGVSPAQTGTKFIFGLGILMVLIVIIVVLAMVLPGNNDETESLQTPDTINFQTGVSLITSYHIDSEITSRMARTIVSMEIVNALRCSSIKTVTLQLPLGTRVAGLKVISFDDEQDTCTADGVVKQLDDARESFLESASEGLPGAYVEEQDTFSHSLQVSMPPLGKANVELILEQLLQQRLGRVEFQLPFAPNEDVDSMSMNLKVQGVNEFMNSSLVMEVGDDLKSELENSFQDENVTGLDGNLEFNLDLSDTREFRYLPKIIGGSYVPAEFSESGELHVSNGPSWSCFEHYFRPPNLGPMSKHMVWLVDTTMQDAKLNHTKQALKDFISDSLHEKDSFYIQLFGNRATEDAMLSSSATAGEKQRAMQFIDKEWPQNYAVNFHAAFLEGILRAKNAKTDAGVTVLVVVSDSSYFQGEWDRKKIVEDIYVANYQTEGNPVKIFTLGFEDSSDTQLLSGIAVTNDGVSVSLSGPSFKDQFQNFFESEFSNVILSNVAIDYQPTNGTRVKGQTIQSFPVLSDGKEVVVRGLLENTRNTTILGSDTLQATTIGFTNVGENIWQVKATTRDTSTCYQSYAHSRIDQLLRFRDVSELVGEKSLKRMVNLVTPCPEDKKLVDCIEEEATDLAIAANIVAQGITGMVTVDHDDCLSFEGETEICRDGTIGEFYYEDYYGNGGTESDFVYGPAYSEAFGHRQYFVILIIKYILSSFFLLSFFAL
ncbi:vault protein inter-alpha-trypsin domain containing protein [Nitzschia inconspicua]|uniref:Vault protein inter-alpha-trypsin domain containing protein n=1 Tax=Nitzschia inconspicua TaxID=303405 RepID=A0A9K3PM91_9STRA|nr:vault protein inter-alpha-trypsin domain containing protein [Nitzschia inconspicua]